jgi:hypothetical protein
MKTYTSSVTEQATKINEFVLFQIFLKMFFEKVMKKFEIIIN